MGPGTTKRDCMTLLAVSLGIILSVVAVVVVVDAVMSLVLVVVVLAFLFFCSCCKSDQRKDRSQPPLPHGSPWRVAHVFGGQEATQKFWKSTWLCGTIAICGQCRNNR